jgi:hypothetical protein
MSFLSVIRGPPENTKPHPSVVRNGVWIVRHGKPFRKCVYGFFLKWGLQKKYNRCFEEINLFLDKSPQSGTGKASLINGDWPRIAGDQGQLPKGRSEMGTPILDSTSGDISRISWNIPTGRWSIVGRLRRSDYSKVTFIGVSGPRLVRFQVFYMPGGRGK